MSKINRINVDNVSYDVEDTSKLLQIDTMPVASEDTIGKIIQYTGTTDANYTNGYFYKCVSDGEQEPTYSWEPCDTQSDITYLNPSSENPFIFDGTKKGLYYFKYNSKFYYKITSETERKYLSGKYVYLIVFYDDYTYDGTSTQQIPCEIFYLKINAYDSSIQGRGEIENVKVKNGNELNVNDGHYGQLVSTSYQTIQGVKEFYDIPKQNNTNAPTQDNEFTNKKYVDDSLSVKEDTSNKVTSLDAQSTDTEYPSAKAVWDLINEIGSGFSGKEFSFSSSANSPTNLFDFEPGVYINTNYTTSSCYVYKDRAKTTPMGINTPFIFIMCKKIGDVAPETNEIVAVFYEVAMYETNPGIRVGKITHQTDDTLIFNVISTGLIPLKSGNQDIPGIKTFLSPPRTSYNPTNDNDLARKKYIDDLVATKTTQYSTMPTADSTTVGKIIQYTGTTDANYTNGYFYIGVTDGEDPATYSWEQTNIQPAPSNVETTTNKVSSITSSSTNTEYPGAKAVWDLISNLSSLKLETKIFSNSQYFNFSTEEPGIYVTNALYGGAYDFKYSTGVTIATVSGFKAFAVLLCKRPQDAVAWEEIGVVLGVSTRSGSYGCYATQSIYVDRDLTPMPDPNHFLTYDNMHFISTDAQTINGVKTFTSFPITPSSAPTTDYQIANKKYVDDKIGNINTILATLTTPSNNGGGE